MTGRARSDDAPRRGARGLEVRWRQFRNAPRPVVRAVGASLTWRSCWPRLPRLRRCHEPRRASSPAATCGRWRYPLRGRWSWLIGTVVTYLIVPQPTGRARVTRRTAWSAALGFFAAVPIAYLVLVVAIQIIRPLLG